MPDAGFFLLPYFIITGPMFFFLGVLASPFRLARQAFVYLYLQKFLKVKRKYDGTGFM